jgi:glucosamine-6-phosphate deaminase
MNVFISENKTELGCQAATAGASLIRKALKEKGNASIIVATGASQFELLEALVCAKDIDWRKVTAFHLDEYIGMTMAHPASFRRYLKERFVERLSVPLSAFHYINAETNAAEECSRLNKLIGKHVIDVAFVGIGENAHLAFNDPPADFDTKEPYLVVHLNEACRRQQLGEGWFPTFEEVPKQAISMSCYEIMRSKAIICSVPDLRKATAVKNVLEGPITPNVPASILQRHQETAFYLDKASSSLSSAMALKA